MNTQAQIIRDFENSIDLKQDVPTTNWEENDKIEFKKSLQTKSETIGKEYLKTITGFANNLGGVIIFGISPEKKELVGIKAELENLDNRFISSTISNAVDGSFQYSFFTIRILGRIIGFLKIDEAVVKPVILKVDSSEFKMGEIYFRYPAQTTKILASDLRRIINEEISNRLRHTIGNISKLVEIGDNAAILNTISGEIELSNTTTKLIIDESILSRLNLIKEGHFVDKEGSPAYIIKGEIESSNIEVIEKTIPSIINETEIFEYFLNSKCEFPKVVIERLVFSQSAYNPIHFFIKEAEFTKEDAVKYIECIDKPEINQVIKDKILERINGYNYNSQGKILEYINTEFNGNYLNIDTIVEQIMLENNIKKSKLEQLKRTLFYNSLVARAAIPEDILQKELKCVLEAFSNLKGEHLLVDKDYYLNILKSFFPLDKLTTPLISLLRKVICFTDEVYYKH